MTTRHLAQVQPSELQHAAFTHGVDIEIDTTNDRAYVTIGAVTLYAELAAEVPC